jgi:hypothetical protein
LAIFISLLSVGSACCDESLALRRTEEKIICELTMPLGQQRQFVDLIEAAQWSAANALQGNANPWHENGIKLTYFTDFRGLKMTQDAEGVLIVEFHSHGGPLNFTAQDHTDFVDAFYRISQDRAN